MIQMTISANSPTGAPQLVVRLPLRIQLLCSKKLPEENRQGFINLLIFRQSAVTIQKTEEKRGKIYESG